MSTPAAGATPAQTVGPFFHLGLPWPGDRDLVPPGSSGAVRLHGRVLDGAGEPVPDALLELWQVGPDGLPVREPGSIGRDGHTFTGFGRCASDAEGGWSFTTLLPGLGDGGGAPFFALSVFARGLLDCLFTRAYLPPGHGGTAEALAADPLLAGLEPARRESLLTRPDDDGGLRFDVRLQGEGETVFLAHRPPASARTLGG